MDGLAFTGGAADAGAASALALDAGVLASFPGSLAQAAVQVVSGFILDPKVRTVGALRRRRLDSPPLSRTMTQVDLLGVADDLASQFGVKSKPFRGALRTLLLLFQGSARHASSQQQFASDLEKLGESARPLWAGSASRVTIGLCAGIGGEAATVLLDAWQRDGLALASELCKRASLPHHALVDVEWRFGVTIATQDVQRAGATYVHLRLSLAGQSGGVGVGDAAPPREELLELSLPQFYAMLAALERAKSYAAFLSSDDAAIAAPAAV